jgi:hypothetical protein
VTQAELLIPGAKMGGVSKRGEELRESGGEEDLGLGLGLFASHGEKYEWKILRAAGKKYSFINIYFGCSEIKLVSLFASAMLMCISIKNIIFICICVY